MKHEQLIEPWEEKSKAKSNRRFIAMICILASLYFLTSVLR